MVATRTAGDYLAPMRSAVHPDLFEGLDPSVRKVVMLAIGSHADGRTPNREDIADLVDRVTGRISFEEYLRRARRRRAARPGR